MIWKQQVVDNFGNAAQRYDSAAHVQAGTAKTLLSLCPDLPDNADILEIGCGTGALTKSLIGKYPTANLHVTDISKSMLEHAKTVINHDRVTWAVMDGEMPRLEKTYDLITANMVFQWFENRTRAIDGLTRYLKPGGKILYSMPGPESFLSWRQVLMDLSYPCGMLDFADVSMLARQEYIKQDVESAYGFLKSLKIIGAHKPRQGYIPLSSGQLKKACQEFDVRQNTSITWHVIYDQHSKSG